MPPPAPSPPDAARLVGTTLELTLARAPDLTRPAGSYTHGPTRTVVVNLGAAGYRAFDNTCPHAGCGVSGFDGQTMVCPCHRSEFDPASGARVSGPAERGLTPRPATLDAAAGILRVVVG